MVKSIVNYIISFFLSVSIILLVLLMILSNTAFSKNYTIALLEESNYYEKTYEYIMQNFSNHIMQSGLEESDLQGIISVNKVWEDVLNVVNCIYENREININTESIEQNLNERITAILNANGRKPDNEEREAIKNFLKTISDEYVANICFSKNYIVEISKNLVKIQKLIETGLIISSAFVAILLVLILLINRKIKHSAKYIGISLMTSGILAILVKILLESRVQNMLILSPAFSDAIILMINSIINTFFLCGIIMSIVGLGISIIGNKYGEE